MVATNYFLSQFVPQHQAAMTLRSKREARTLSRVPVLLASGQRTVAADLVAQRIKAIERSIVDGVWTRAQYLELIPPEGATLLEKDEDVMVAKEAEMEERLRMPYGRGRGAGAAGQGPQWEEQSWNSSPPGGKGKGKGKGRGKTKEKGRLRAEGEGGAGARQA